VRRERNERYLETRPFTKKDYPSETTDMGQTIDCFTRATNGLRRGKIRSTCFHLKKHRLTVRTKGEVRTFCAEANGVISGSQKVNMDVCISQLHCYSDLRLVDTRDRVGKLGSSRCPFELFLFTMFCSLG
jgi:hypothetical protein